VPIIMPLTATPAPGGRPRGAGAARAPRCQRRGHACGAAGRQRRAARRAEATSARGLTRKARLTSQAHGTAHGKGARAHCVLAGGEPCHANPNPAGRPGRAVGVAEDGGRLEDAHDDDRQDHHAVVDLRQVDLACARAARVASGQAPAIWPARAARVLVKPGDGSGAEPRPLAAACGLAAEGAGRGSRCQPPRDTACAEPKSQGKRAHGAGRRPGKGAARHAHPRRPPTCA